MLSLSPIPLFVFRAVINLSELSPQHNIEMYRVNDIAMHRDKNQYRQAREDIARIIEHLKQEKQTRRDRKQESIPSMAQRQPPNTTPMVIRNNLNTLQETEEESFRRGQFGGGGRFRYINNPDDPVGAGKSHQNVAGNTEQRSQPQLSTPQKASFPRGTSFPSFKPSLTPSGDSTTNTEPPQPKTTHLTRSIPNQQEVVDLSDNLLTLLDCCDRNGGQVTINSENLDSILRNLCTLQEHNQHLTHRLKHEQMQQERSHLAVLEHSQCLQERCGQLEQDIDTLTRYKVICSICLDAVDEIVCSKRILVSTLCGHIFCDQCLQRSMLYCSATTKQAPNGKTSKRFTCPRCRKSVQVSSGEASKFAHALFI